MRETIPESIFRAYDIRGIVGLELNEFTLGQIGFHLGQAVLQSSGHAVAVGYDARTHGPELFEWLCAGLHATGVQIYSLGMIPTPVAYFACFVDLGVEVTSSVMLTGSHNPPEYNGLKMTIEQKPFFGPQILAIQEAMKKKVHHISGNAFHTPLPALERYIDWMVDHFSHLRGSAGIPKLAIDHGNGVSALALMPILERLKIPATHLYFEPDGTFPNHHPDPSEEANLSDLRALLGGESDLGFAFDGDADRLALLTPTHTFRGDELAILYAKKMENPLVIGEVKCSQGMYDTINTFGRTHMGKTGHSNMKVMMKELGASLAAEVSGHLFFADRYFGYDDAIYAALRALELLHSGMDLERERQLLPRLFSTPEIHLETTEEEKFAVIERLHALLQNPPKNFPEIREIITIDGLRVVFEHGFGLVRASNTTPKLVTRFEADTPERAKVYESSLRTLLEIASKSAQGAS